MMIPYDLWLLLTALSGSHVVIPHLIGAQGFFTQSKFKYILDKKIPYLCGTVWCIFTAVRNMDLEKGPRRSRGMTTLEKFLIFLFAAMSAVCIGLIVLYFTDKSDSSTSAEGEYVYYSNTKM